MPRLRRSDPGAPGLARRRRGKGFEVVEGIAAGSAYTTNSLDAPAGNDGDGPRQLGDVDVGFAHVVDIEQVGRMLEVLPEREREIVRLRFYEDLSQSEIAERVGISQMHVSRLLRRSFETMRRQAENV